MNIVTTYPNITPLNLHPQVESAQRDVAQREVVPATTQTYSSANGAEIGSNRDKEKQAENRFSENGYDSSTDVAEDVTYSSIVHGRSEGDSEQKQSDSGTGEDKQSKNNDKSASGETLTDSEQSEVNELKARDTEVRTHENQHKSVGGQYAAAPSYSYERGPDGRNYATDGEVSISVSKESTPEATISKMKQVYSAALAPAEPSSQDRQVANQAKKIELQATQEKNENARNEATEKRSQNNDSETNKSNFKPSSASSFEDSYVTTKRHQEVISNRYQGSWMTASSSVHAFA